MSTPADPCAPLLARAEGLLSDVSLSGVAAWKAANPGALAVGIMPVFAPRPLFEAQGVLPVNIFGGGFTDMLSGYRVFSKRYVKSFPALSHGFEIETELTVHALELRMPYGEVMTPYYARPEGSESKLSTYRDGFRILGTILRLYVRERPFSFFGSWGALLALLSILISIPLFVEYFHSGLVPRFPTAMLSASMMVCAMLSVTCGLILDNVTTGRHETKRLAYLNIPFRTP